MGEIIYLFVLSLIRLQVRPVDGLFTGDSSKDVKSRKGVFFGVIKLKFNIKSLFVPEDRQNLAQNGLGITKR